MSRDQLFGRSGANEGHDSRSAVSFCSGMDHVFGNIIGVDPRLGRH